MGALELNLVKGLRIETVSIPNSCVVGYEPHVDLVESLPLPTASTHTCSVLLRVLSRTDTGEPPSLVRRPTESQSSANNGQNG
jgi:hypothetical protein